MSGLETLAVATPQTAPRTRRRENAGCASFTAQHEEAGLDVSVDLGTARLIIVAARFSGGRDDREREVLAGLCSLIVGRPLQEAADHGAVYLLESKHHVAVEVPGIRVPRNAGPAFALAERLIRGVFAAARESLQIDPRANRWYVRPDADWLGKSEREQAGQLKPLLADFLHAASIGQDDVWISRIERGVRVTVGLVDSLPHAGKAKLLLDLERRLQHDTGMPIEIFLEDKKDANNLRRL